MTNTAQLKQRLTRQNWIEATFELLTEEGICSVVIDRLATKLGVTRGSFYHHFSDRDDLLGAVLDYWAEQWTYTIREHIGALGLDPSTTLLALMKAIRRNRAADYDAPIRAWALHDPTAHRVVKRADEARLAFVRSQFTALGFSGMDAENRARLYLHYEMTAPSMFAGSSRKHDEELLEVRHRFLTTASTE